MLAEIRDLSCRCISDAGASYARLAVSRHADLPIERDPRRLKHWNPGFQVVDILAPGGPRHELPCLGEMETTHNTSKPRQTSQTKLWRRNGWRSAKRAACVTYTNHARRFLGRRTKRGKGSFADRPSSRPLPHVSFGPFPAAAVGDRPSSLQHPARQSFPIPEQVPGLFTRGQ